MKKLYKIATVLMIILIMQSCSVAGLIQANKKITGDFQLELQPKNSYGYYDMSINVIQGIASFENGWFTSQTSANKYLSINYLSEDGKSVFNKRFTIESHGQDLSLEKISENELILYTTLGHYNKEGKSGLLCLKVTLPEKIDGQRDMSKTEISIHKKIDLKLDNSTPTLSTDANTFAIRSGNSIVVASKTAVLNNDLSNAKTFSMDKSQLEDNGKTLWFQGIAMKDNQIYCMTGNNSVNSPKKLYVYNTKGEVVKKHSIDHNDFAKSVGNKYEPEGITFVGNELYYTIIAKGKTGGNKKFLYRLH